LNFLAHAVLAGEAPALIVGGVVGDWIKGPLPGALPPDLAAGVALHRAIDSHVDSHPAFRRSRARVSAVRRRYGGVLVDLFYDHLLARDWTDFNSQPLRVYCATVYRMIEARRSDLPSAVLPGLSLMAQEDWLTSYAAIESIGEVLRRMSRRARRPNPLANGEAEFLTDVEGFAADFRECFEDTRVFCRMRAAGSE